MMNWILYLFIFCIIYKKSLKIKIVLCKKPKTNKTTTNFSLVLIQIHGMYLRNRLDRLHRTTGQ